MYIHILYRDDNVPENVVPKYWGNRAHKEDILCLAYCEPNVLVSASYDGDIIVWDVDGEKKLVRMNAHDEASRNGSQLTAHSHRVSKKSMDVMKDRMKKLSVNNDTFSTASRRSAVNSTTNPPTMSQQLKSSLTAPSMKNTSIKSRHTATATNAVSGAQQCPKEWDKNNSSFTDRAVEKVSMCCQ